MLTALCRLYYTDSTLQTALYRLHFTDRTIQSPLYRLHYKDSILHYTDCIIKTRYTDSTIQTPLYRLHYTDPTIQTPLYRLHYTDYSADRDQVWCMRDTTVKISSGVHYSKFSPSARGIMAFLNGFYNTHTEGRGVEGWGLRWGW